MKKKILLITAFLALAMLVTPIMAAPATKIPVTVTQIGGTSMGTYHMSEHGNRVVLQLRDGVGTSMLTLNLPGGPVNGEGSGTVQGKIIFYQLPPDPNAVGIYQAHMVWTFGGEGTTGTFEGVRKSKVIGYGGMPGVLTPYVETSCVLHGTGDFLGQTLKLSYEGDAGGVINWEGTLLIPK
jgi:hypothetical protein